jgi:hypothetical protein
MYACKPPPPYPGLNKEKQDKLSSESSSASNLSLSKDNGINCNGTQFSSTVSKLSPATSIVSAQVHTEPHRISNGSINNKTEDSLTNGVKIETNEQITEPQDPKTPKNEPEKEKDNVKIKQTVVMRRESSSNIPKNKVVICFVVF